MSGAQVDRLVEMTNFNFYEAIQRFQRILDGMGVLDALRDAGVEAGDTVVLGGFEMEWQW